MSMRTAPYILSALLLAFSNSEVVCAADPTARTKSFRAPNFSIHQRGDNAVLARVYDLTMTVNETDDGRLEYIGLYYYHTRYWQKHSPGALVTVYFLHAQGGPVARHDFRVPLNRCTYGGYESNTLGPGCLQGLSYDLIQGIQVVAERVRPHRWRGC